MEIALLEGLTERAYHSEGSRPDKNNGKETIKISDFELV